MTLSLRVALLSCVLGLAACSDDANTDTIPSTVDMATTPKDMASTPEDMATTPKDMATLPDLGPKEDATTFVPDQSTAADLSVADLGTTGDDIGTVGDDLSSMPDAGGGCDEAALLAASWPMPQGVSTAEVQVTRQGATSTATIDASAGGSAMAAQNPFVFLDLDQGQKVATGAPEALRSNVTWELAFRRTAVFINGGDSGPGSVEITRLTGKTFDEVTAQDVPTRGSFLTEDPVDAMCMVPRPSSGFGTVGSVFERLNPDTTSSSWYNYSMGGGAPSVTAYPDHVYIIQGTDAQKRYKFGFISWVSGTYTVQWAEIQ